MRQHAFVAMPFGEKENIDFNAIYDNLIKPAVKSAGFEIFRADEEQRAGEIRTDMFQELLLADLVIVDLTIDNPNVWYELGVRHALRSRGVILISGSKTTAFDVYTDRKLRYSIENGKPNTETLEDDKKRLTEMIKETMQSWYGRKISPVYQLMPNLQEPDWKSLKVGNVVEFWEEHQAWVDRIELARKSSNIGDILLLADEAPISAFRAEAWIIAGSALRRAQHFVYALELLEQGLKIEPNNLKGLHEKGMCLQRLAINGLNGHTLDRARQHYQNVLTDFSNDSETWALLGRVDKDEWVGACEQHEKSLEEIQEEGREEASLLRAAIDSYSTAYCANQGHYYSGINALTLMHLYQFLTNDKRYKDTMNIMSGAVRFSAECETDKHGLFWAKATLGDLEVLTGTSDSVKETYKEAIVLNDKDWFALESCKAQLILLKKFGFQMENIEAGLEVFDKALGKLKKPEEKWEPRKVFLFSGHMIDQPGRLKERFPASKKDSAKEKIVSALENLGAGPDDLALTQGACGGDILFTEACHQLDVKVNWMQPFVEPEFIQKSIQPYNDEWKQRYFSEKEKLVNQIICAPESLGPIPKKSNDGYAYERCNLWLLYTALSYGIDKVHFVCLWDGEQGDGPGGTVHMYEEVKNKTGQVTWINTKNL